MQIRVKSIDGRDSTLEVDDDATVAQLRACITEQLGIPDDRMRIIFQGKHLGEPHELIRDRGLENGLVIHVVERPPNLDPLPRSPPPASRPSFASQMQSLFDNFTGGGPGGQRPLFPTRGRPSFFSREEDSLQVQTIIPVMRHGEALDNASIERIVRDAIAGMERIPEEHRGNIAVSWRGSNSISIRIPPLTNPFVASPAMERMHVIDSALRSIRHFRTIVDENTELSAAVDAIIDGQPLPMQQTRVQEIAALLDDYPVRVARRFTDQHPDNFEEPERSARFETSSDHNGSPNHRFTMRHVLASDLSEILDGIFSAQEQLRPHIDRYRAILRMDQAFNITPSTITSDVNANVLCVYIEHIQRTIHRLSHAVHIASDLNIHLEDPIPRRVMPNYVNFHVPAFTQGEVTIELIDPNESHPTAVQNSVPASELLPHPISAHDMFTLPPGVTPMMTLFPTGFVQQVAIATVTMPIPVEVGVHVGIDHPHPEHDQQGAPPVMFSFGGHQGAFPLPEGMDEDFGVFASGSGGTAQSQRDQPGTGQLERMSSEELTSIARMFLAEVNPSADQNANVFEELFRAQVEQAFYSLPQDVQNVARQNIMQGPTINPESSSSSSSANVGIGSAAGTTGATASLVPPFSQAINEAARNIIGQGLGATVSRNPAMLRPLFGLGGRPQATNQSLPSPVTIAPPPFGRFGYRTTQQQQQLNNNGSFPVGAPLPFHFPRPRQLIQPRPPMGAIRFPRPPTLPGRGAPGVMMGMGVRPLHPQQILNAPRAPAPGSVPSPGALESLRAANQVFDLIGARMNQTAGRVDQTIRQAENLRERIRNAREQRNAATAAPSNNNGNSSSPSSGNQAHQQRPAGAGPSNVMPLGAEIVAAGPGGSPVVNEQLITFDPFLQCNSRFTGRNVVSPDSRRSHYQNISNRSPGRPLSRDPPEEYVNLSVPLNNSGDVVAEGDAAADNLRNLIQLSLRSVYALMRENDADRASRIAAPVNAIMNNMGMGMHGPAVDEVQVDVHVDGQFMSAFDGNVAEAGGIFAGANGDQLLMNLSIPPSAPAASSNAPAPGPIARPVSAPALPQLPQNPPEIRSLQAGEASTSSNNSPRPKKRKTEDEDAEASSSGVNSSNPSRIIQSSRGTGLQHSNSSPLIERVPLSNGYQLGLPPHVRSNVPSPNELRALIQQLTALHLNNAQAR